jgi:hypothetical protein
MARWRYPEDWPAISRRIRERDGWRCRGPVTDDGRLLGTCGAENGKLHPVTSSKVVLTVAHVLNPDPLDCRDENLAALCQRCHLNHDRAHHMRNAAATRRRRKGVVELFPHLA